MRLIRLLRNFRDELLDRSVPRTKKQFEQKQRVCSRLGHVPSSFLMKSMLYSQQIFVVECCARCQAPLRWWREDQRPASN